ncbi:MAG: enoyl-CoA hydratase-related protein [Pseudomonadota bacterium]
MTSDLIETLRDGDVAIIRLNDPKTLNAITPEMAEALTEHFIRAGAEARAILFEAAGRGFSSGANLAGDAGLLADENRDLGAHLETAYNPLVRAMRDSPVPIVSAVRGPCAGIGCAFALMGDIIIASETAYFLMAFANIALVPDGGSAYLLARAVGRVKAMEMMLLGERLPASDAHAGGLITRLVADDALDEEALAMARRLAAGPTKALGAIRASAWAALDSTLDEQLDRERVMQRDASRTQDFVEGVTAFFQKRAANFKGK